MSVIFSRRSFLRSVSSLPIIGAPGLAFAAATGERRVSGPFTHENLAIYLVHGPSAPGPIPLTLAEAMARGKTKVFETGNVSELSIENIGDEEVFVQSGDIVKGGQQDRVLTVSLVLPARSGKMPIASYCVEQGRWSARGREDVKTFATAAASLPSREAKLAMKVAQAAHVAEPTPARSTQAGIVRARPMQQAPSAQGQVWDSVAKTQGRLASAVGAPVAARESTTSMQLTLENEKLKASQAGFAAALAGRGLDGGDIVGYVFAVNGKINSADLYPSNGLFRKMWNKNFDASITEALAAKSEVAGEAPTTEAVLAFLDAAEKGKPSERAINKQVALETREAPGNFMFETRAGKGGYVHRNYLAK